MVHSFKAELLADLQLGLAVALSISCMQQLDFAKLGIEFPGMHRNGVLHRLSNAIVGLFVASLLRMAAHDAAPPTADRQAMKAFIFSILTFTPAFMIKALLAALNTTLPGTVSSSWVACTTVHLCVAFGSFMIAWSLGFLPTDAPPKRDSWAQVCSTSTMRVYVLHFSALLNGATALPIGFAWNQLKNDLFALLPIPAEASVAGLACTVLIQTALCILLSVVRMSLDWVNGTTLAAKLCPPPVLARHKFLQAKTLEFMLAWAIYDVLQSVWAPVSLSPCAPSLLPTLLPGSQHWVAPLVLLLILCLSMFAALYPRPEKIAGSALLGASLGMLVATLGIQLGWAFRDSYIALVEFVLPLSADTVNLGLIFSLLGVIAMLRVLDQMPKNGRVEPSLL